jgi:hypothetical protein
VALQSSEEAIPHSAPDGRRAAAWYALLATILAFAWQALTVQFNFDGNWSALFQTGAAWALPPGQVFENTYRFENSGGFDGQFYRYIAHDPLLSKNFQGFVDFPRLRWERILVPGLAYVVALGQDRFIDAAYSAVVLAFVFLGSFWLAQYFQRHKRSAAWGLAFLLVPTVTISIERLTIDIALTAFCIGFALYAERQQGWQTYVILTLAPLARETGIFLIAAYVLYQLSRKHWRGAILAAATALPFLLWFLFVRAHTGPGPVEWGNFLPSLPFQGILLRTFQPLWLVNHETWKQTLAGLLDHAALLGVWFALFVSVRLLRRRKWSPLEFSIGAFALLAVLLANLFTWGEAYAFGRYLSPLLAWLAMIGLVERRLSLALPLCLVTLRVVAQITPQALGIVAGIFGFDPRL